MPHLRRPLLFVSIALLAAGTAHAEPRRAAQSFPAPMRFSPPAPPPQRSVAPSRTARDEDARAPVTRSRITERSESSNNGRDERGGRGGKERYDNHRYDNDRDEYEKGKEREGHHFEHHGRDDSPGC